MSTYKRRDSKEKIKYWYKSKNTGRKVLLGFKTENEANKFKKSLKGASSYTITKSTATFKRKRRSYNRSPFGFPPLRF